MGKLDEQQQERKEYIQLLCATQMMNCTANMEGVIALSKQDTKIILANAKLMTNTLIENDLI